MKHRYSYLKNLVIAGSIALGACNGKSPETTDTEATPDKTPADTVILSDKAAANADIATAVAGPGTLEKRLTLQGEIRAVPEKLAAVTARLEGVVIRVEKKEGDKVHSGEPIVTIESKKLAETKLAYLEAEHKLQFTKEALAREKALLDKKITPEEVYRKVEHDYEEAELAHTAALQRLKLLGFQESFLHKIEKNPNHKLTSYTLRAPFEGEVIGKDVTLGEAVMEEKELFSLADLSELLVEIKVPLASVGAFSEGAKAVVECDILDIKTEGTVRHIASVADADTRTIAVQILIPNPEGKWRPGMPARVISENAKIPADIAVPIGALQEIEGKTAVFVETAVNQYRLTHVETGDRDAERVTVLSGLKSGDNVAVKNSLVLKSEWLKTQGE